MPSPSEISSFRPRRALLGYERKETDEFLEHVAELLERAGKRIEDSEAELARHQEKEQSLNEALLAVAKTADAIKRDARSEAETIRAGALELDQFVATTRAQLSAFLRETLETLERLAGEIQTRGQLAHSEEPAEPDLSPALVEELAPSLPVDASRAGDGSPEAAESVLERLRPYRADASGTVPSHGS
jgi:chromosome segregation ATPase